MGQANQIFITISGFFIPNLCLLEEKRLGHIRKEKHSLAFH